jgi:uncharacterized PurR-regulated membrane protein YhhQ (DUF165 family)
MSIVLYILAIAGANIVTAATAPAELGPWLVPWGTFAVAVTFVLRDWIQLRYGRRRAYEAIVLGLGAALVTSVALGDTTMVVAGSALAFAASETLDTEVFTRMKAPVAARVAVSGVLGSALDTVIFVMVGLVGGGIIPMSAAVNAMVGVFLVKAVLQLLAAGAWQVARPRLVAA